MLGGQKDENLKTIMTEVVLKGHKTQPQELRQKTEWDYGVSLTRLVTHL